MLVVSTGDQDLIFQLQVLKEAGYKKFTRKKFQKLILNDLN